MTVFGRALATLFADANICVAVLYRAEGVGAGVEVRAARYRPSGSTAWAGSEIISDGEQIEVRQSDTPALAEGDTFEIDDDLWAVDGDPERGEFGLTWIATIRAAA